MATTLVVRQNNFNLTEYDYNDSFMMKPQRSLSLEVLNEAGNVLEDIPEDSQCTDYSLSDIEDGLEIAVDKSVEVRQQNLDDAVYPISTNEDFANYCMNQMSGLENDFSFDYSFNEEKNPDSLKNREEFSTETSTASALSRSSALSSSVWSLANSRRGSETSTLNNTKKTTALFTKKGIMHIINLFENTDSKLSKSDIRVLDSNTLIDKNIDMSRSRIPSDVGFQNDHKTGLLIGHKKHSNLTRQRSKSQGAILDSESTDRTADKNNNNNDPSNFMSLSRTVNRDRTGHAVAQWKHYKRAMETYRKSAEKAETTNTKGVSDKNKTPNIHISKTSTPEHKQQSKTLDLPGNHTLPRSSAVLSFSSSSVSNEEKSPGIINSNYSPISPYCQTPVSPLYTTLDYKTILRRTRSKRMVTRALIPSPVGLQVDQNVFVEDNPDPVTDIDDFLGLCGGAKIATPARDHNSTVVVTNTSHQRVRSPEGLKKGSPSRVACKRKSPEKVVWSGYTKLLDEKKRCEQTVKNGFLTRLERKNFQKNTPVNAYGSNEPCTENNLRRNALISKRNRSVAHNYIYLDPSTHNGCNMAYSMREYHTVASPGRLSKLSKMKKSIDDAVSTGSTLSQSKKFWKLADKKSQLELPSPESRSHSRSLDDRRLSEEEGDDDVFYTSYHDRKSLLRKFKTELRVKNSFKRGKPIDIVNGDSDLFAKNVKKPPSPKTFSYFRSAIQSKSPNKSPLRRGGLKLLKSTGSKGHFLLDLTKSARKSLKSSPKQVTSKSRIFSEEPSESNDIYYWSNNKDTSMSCTAFEGKERVPNMSNTTPNLDQASRPSSTDAYDIISSYTSSFRNNSIENDSTAIRENGSSRNENGSNHVTVTTHDAEDDYVNFDDYYKNKRMSRFEIDDILSEDMSKLDLNIEEYFSFLGNNKSSSTTPVSETRLSLLVADKSESTNAQTEPNTVDEIMNTITDSSFRSDQKSDTISRKPNRHHHNRHHRRRKSVRCGNVPSYVPDYIKPAYSSNKTRKSSACYQLTLNKTNPTSNDSLKIASTFIKRPSIQQLGAITFRESAKTWSGRMTERKKIRPGHNGRIGSISLAKLLRSNGIKLSLAPNNHAAPPPVPNSNQNLPMATIDIKSVPEEHKKDKDKKKKKKKGKLTKADISTPQNFQHVGHVGWDPNKGFDINEVDPAIKDLFHCAGITEKQMQDKETAQFIYDFIEQRGGVDAVKRDTQARHVTGPPPPARGRDQPPPPPPSRGHQAPPPPPHRIDSHGPPPAPPSRREPPPPPNRQVRQPPAQSSRLPPPPPPTNVPPPPPPPPPPVGGAPPPPPSSSSDRSGLLGQIRDGHSLKPASDRAPVESSGGGGGRGALLDQIRQGKQLKRVTEEEKCSVQESEDGGIAGALARALIMRDKVIHTDSESDSDNNDFDDDDDWED